MVASSILSLGAPVVDSIAEGEHRHPAAGLTDNAVDLAGGERVGFGAASAYIACSDQDRVRLLWCRADSLQPKDADEGCRHAHCNNDGGENGPSSTNPPALRSPSIHGSSPP